MGDNSKSNRCILRSENEFENSDQYKGYVNDMAPLGCGIQSSSTNIGASFNDNIKYNNKKGIFVLEWEHEKQIRAFYFPDALALPDDSHGGSPLGANVNTAEWTKNLIQPYAVFPIGADAGCADHFKDQKLIFNIALCGDWAGNTWNVHCDSSCLYGNDCSGNAVAKCVDFVKKNPSEFSEAYWLINSVSVFEASKPIESSTTKEEL